MLVSRYADYGTYNNDKVNSDYNSYSDVKTQAAGAVNVQSGETEAASGQAVGHYEKSDNKAPKHSNPTDFTFDFKKENRFNLEGATKDYEDINVGRALSDMKKDVVLDKYKFFVDTPNLGTDSDGTVRIIRK